MRALAEEELKSRTSSATRSEEIDLPIPKDPNDEKNVILEIRAGLGRRGCALLRRSFQHIKHGTPGLEISTMSVSHGDAGGLKKPSPRSKARRPVIRDESGFTACSACRH
jgi:peptide chain release factor 1